MTASQIDARIRSLATSASAVWPVSGGATRWSRSGTPISRATCAHASRETLCALSFVSRPAPKSAKRG
jgi:hypothetical protein